MADARRSARPTYHHYRPLEPGVTHWDAMPRPCLKCKVCLSTCKCDADAEERRNRRNERNAQGSHEGGKPLLVEGEATPTQWHKTISRYSWRDNDDGNGNGGNFVSVYISIDESDELRRDHVSVSFGPNCFSVAISLPLGRQYTLRVDNLYGAIDGSESTWFLTKGKRRLVIKLAKENSDGDGFKPWPGLTKVFAITHSNRSDGRGRIDGESGALDFGLAAFTGIVDDGRSEGASGNVPHIVTGPKKEYWQGPPKYEWDRSVQD